MQSTKSRQYQLFKLLTKEDSYKPANYFKECLGVSLKTIYNDVEALMKDMEPYHLSLSKIPRNGMKLIGLQEDIDRFQSYLLESDVEEDIAYSPSTRRMWILHKLILEEEVPLLSEMESLFYVTSASIRADLSFLQEFLNPFHVHIYTSKSRIHVKGRESALQKAYKTFLLDICKQRESFDSVMDTSPLDVIVKEVFEPITIELATHMIHTLADMTSLSISEYYTSSLYLSILILLSRITNNRHIEDSEIAIDDISYMEPYMIAFELADNMEKKSGLQLNEEDICYLSEQLFAHRIEPTNTTIIVDEDYHSCVDMMIARMAKILEVDLQDDVKLRNSLLSHIPAMIYRMKRKIKITNPLLSEIKKQYIVLFSLTWYVASDLEQRYSIVLDDDEISFLFIYFQVSLEKRHGVHFKNIVIVCPIGLAMSELVFTKVRQFLPTRDNIVTMSANELYKSDLSKIDFVISTMKLKEIEAPVIYTSPLMSDDDIQRITSFYSKLNKQYSTLQQIAMTHSLEIGNYLQKQFIFFNKQFKDKNDCLDFLIQHYERSHLVNKDFARSVYDREEMGDTSVYTGVAMPHALPETVKKTRIGIVTLKEKIRWGVNDVKVIIMIAIAEKDIDYIGEMLSRLLTIVESPQIINEMLQAKSQNELSQLLHDVLNEPNSTVIKEEVC